MKAALALRGARVLTVMAGGLTAYLLKRHFSAASLEQLEWILRPTVAVVEQLRGMHFERVSGEGYLARSERFLVAPVCAGVNFLVAACLVGCLGFAHRMRSPAACLGLFMGALGVAYLSAIAVNAARITLAMSLHLHPAWSAQLGLSGPDAHRLLGIVLYNIALLALFGVGSRALNDGARWSPREVA